MFIVCAVTHYYANNVHLHTMDINGLVSVQDTI